VISGRSLIDLSLISYRSLAGLLDPIHSRRDPGLRIDPRKKLWLDRVGMLA
jgi:hypothetical protein